MRLRGKTGRGIIETNVPVGAHAEDTQVNAAHVPEFGANARAFSLRIGRVAAKPGQLRFRQSPGCENALTDIRLTGGGVVRRKTAPFVEFEHADLPQIPGKPGQL